MTYCIRGEHECRRIRVKGKVLSQVAACSRACWDKGDKKKMMQSDTYEIRYKTRGEDLRFTERNTMAFNVWRAQRDTRREVERICAIARALQASDDFADVEVVRKRETEVAIEFVGES